MEASIAGQVSWPRTGKPLLVGDYRVCHGTAMQLEPVQAQRQVLLDAFVRLAVTGAPGTDLPPADTEAGAASLASLLRQVWKLRWDNHYKTTLWRLALNGLPVPARMHGLRTEPCGCGARHTPTGELLDRVHLFWERPVARAVVEEVERQLPLEARPLSRRALWLGEAPEGVHDGVWAVVCLAAVEAMERGRARAVRLLLQQHERRAATAAAAAGAGPVQQVLLAGPDGMLALATPEAPSEPPELAPGPAMAVALVALAREWLCGALQEFADLGLAPKAWREEVALGHPFLRWAFPSWVLVRVGE